MIYLPIFLRLKEEVEVNSSFIKLIIISGANNKGKKKRKKKHIPTNT